MYRRLTVLVACCLFVLVQASGHPSYGIVVDELNTIYFADLHHNGRGSVWKLGPKGKLTLLLKNFHAHYLQLAPNGNLVTSHGEGRHLMLQLSGNETDTLMFTDNEEQFFGGNCLLTKEGKILFGIRNFLWMLDENKPPVKYSAHRFGWNQVIHEATDGSIYATDLEFNNGSVIRIDQEGIATVWASDLISKLDRPKDKHNDILLGMASDKQGNIYICELAGKRILKVSGKNRVSTFYQAKDGWYPTGLTFKDDKAYILAYKDTKSGIHGPRITTFENDISQELFNYTTNKLEEPVEEENKGKINYWWIWTIAALIGLVGVTWFGNIHFLKPGFYSRIVLRA